MSRASEIEEAVEHRLTPWRVQLGDDRLAYRNHVVRVLLFADLLYGSNFGDPPASDREEFLTAGVFHDLGIWTANTFDYLEPSVALAQAWLVEHDRRDLIALTAKMIRDHHKITAADPDGSPVEIFRRSDAIDVTCGIRRYGLSYGAYRDIKRAYPDAGFHRRLAQLSTRRALTHPWSPLPMVKF